MNKWNWKNIRLPLMVILMVFLYSFALNRNNKRNIENIEVDFVGNERLFILKETVNKLLIENVENRMNLSKETVVLSRLESVLDKHPMVEEAEVYITPNAQLKAVVRQKTPIARLYTSQGSYYIDYKGTIMPLSDNFTSRVPLVISEINDNTQAQIVALFKYIYDDEFLNKNIIGIHIKSDGTVSMKNRNYNYVIDFGLPTEIERKFNNYKAFFQKMEQEERITQYSKINLRFTKQVVCVRH
ncbi:MAG: cell division protein FtsQ [Bacteroidota bacterium]|nr:cell division protein FtsQ [Bacteroidota bacterium]